jgi:uncharacterized protein (TIGR02145 family)
MPSIESSSACPDSNSLVAYCMRSCVLKVVNFTSVLKIHAAGYLAYGNGVITDRGSGHHYWSSDYSDATFARAYVVFPTNTYTVSNNNRLAGFSVRCIKD